MSRSRFTRGVSASFVLLVVVSVAACSKEPTFKQTYPVTGQVLVDGKPQKMLRVTVSPPPTGAATPDVFGTAYTDDDGKFSISTYKEGDGVPEGDYVMTFRWGDLDVLSNEYAKVDKLGERYNDPVQSKTKFTVKAGQPTDVGKIELTTR